MSEIIKNILVFNLKTDVEDSVLGFTTEWLNFLSKNCEKVIVITMHKGMLQLNSNVVVYSVGKETGVSEFKRLLNFYALLFKVLRENRIDGCFAHMIPLFAIMGWPLLKAKRIPILLWYAHKKVTIMLRIAELLVDNVFTASPTSFMVKSKKVEFVGHGINVTKYKVKSNFDENKFTILCLGRIAPIKNINVLIKAFKILTVDYKLADVELIIVGEPLVPLDEEYLKELNKLTIKLELGKRVLFEGKKLFSKIPDYFMGTDCLVNLSDTDSVDKAVLEAMASGVPVLTSNISFKDVLDKDLGEKLIVPKNDPVKVANSMYKILKMSNGEKIQMGIRLRSNVADKHSLDKLSIKILELLANKKLKKNKGVL